MSIAIKQIVQAGRSPEGPYIFLEALNLGPIPNRIGVPFARKSWFNFRVLRRKDSNAFIYPDFANRTATPAASRIEVGDSATFVFPYTKGCFLAEEFTRVGMSDGFGAIHWAPRRELREARKRYQKRFSFEA
jgi:hypothetical protein